MTTQTEALKMALDFIIATNKSSQFWLVPESNLNKTVTAIKEALEQPEQEPVAYLCENAVGHKYFRWKKPSSTYKPIALYTTPPQRTWVGLMRGVRVEGDNVIISVHYGNDAARQVCGALIDEMNK